MTKYNHLQARIKTKTKTDNVGILSKPTKQAPAMKVAKPKKVKVLVPSERVLHKQVCTFLKLTYPSLIFHSDFGAAAQMTIGQTMASREIQSGKFWPDLFIAMPKKGYSGLFIELKTDHEKIYRKDGTLKESWVTVKKGHMVIGKYDHFAEQANMLERLNKLNYKATFGCGYDECVKILTQYLEG